MAEPAVPSLLPATEAALTLALSEAIAGFRGRVDALASILLDMDDPARAPADVLPYLAFGRGAPLWLERWPESRRRLIIARLERLARSRGSEATFHEWLGHVDAQILRFTTPPQGLTLLRGRTEDEAEALRARHPRVTLRNIREAASRPGRFTIGRPLTFGRSGMSSTEDLRSRTGVSAWLQGPDGEQRLDLISARPASLRAAAFGLPTTRPSAALGRGTSGRRLGSRFTLRRSDAGERVYAFADDGGRAGVVTPTFSSDQGPIGVQPARQPVSAVRPGRFTIGAPLGWPRAGLTTRTDPAGRIEASVRIFDLERARALAIAPTGGWTLGRSRLPQDPFTLRLSIDASRPRRGGFVLGRALPMVAARIDRARPAEILAAARAAALARDRVLVRTDVYRPITAGDGVPLDGSYRAGQLIRSA